MMENGLVIVTGMELPENCYYCRFNYDHLCHALQCSFFNCDGTPREMKGDRLVNCPLKSVLSTEPTVPHEMTAREYAIARRRLCNAHLNAVTQCIDEFVTRCAGCLIEDYCEGAKDDVDEEIAIVEAWAQEHPERSKE